VVKKILAIALSACFLAPAFSQTSVGVSIGINQPGVYGQINIGNFPQPRFINPQPILIAPPARYVQQEPMYLYVPPGHQQNWGKHCHRYNACGRPVYFVHEDWVRERYEEQRRGEGRGDRGDHERGRGHEDRGHGKHEGRRND
jgi:hypothetical protein